MFKLLPFNLKKNRSVLQGICLYSGFYFVHLSHFFPLTLATNQQQTIQTEAHYMGESN